MLRRAAYFGLAEIIYSMAIYYPIALKLHTYGLGRLLDPNWTGRDLFYEIKDRWKKRKEPAEILLKPLERGLAFQLGSIFYTHCILTNEYISSLKSEPLFWYFEDFVSFLLNHNVDSESPYLKKSINHINHVNGLFDRDEMAYYGLVDGSKNKRALIKMFDKLIENQRNVILENHDLYAASYADRVFHDRELCAYLAELMVIIGFDGTESEDEQPKQWVQRVQIPSWAKTTIIARDRGKCAHCGDDITMELSDDQHFDHIIPLAKGGCNDIVNFQLLCSACNLKKSANLIPMKSSIPPYIGRRVL